MHRLVLSFSLSHRKLLKLKDEKHFRKHYQQAAVAAACIEMTIPDKPNSRFPKYHLTEKRKNHSKP